MNEKLERHLDEIFIRFKDLKEVAELRSELKRDLLERIEDLKSQGFSDDEAFAKAVETIGDIEETIHDMAGEKAVLRHSIFTKFLAQSLPNSDFTNVLLHDGSFKGSTLVGSNFSGADLTNSSFSGCDLNSTQFENANLTNTDFNGISLRKASFKNAILEDSSLKGCDLDKTNFNGANLINAKLTGNSLTNAKFVGTKLKGTTFIGADLSGAQFEDVKLDNVYFDRNCLDKTVFANATFLNVIFEYNKKREMRHIVFKDVKMDKSTYELLKSIGVVDLTHVKLI